MTRHQLLARLRNRLCKAPSWTSLLLLLASVAALQAVAPQAGLSNEDLQKALEAQGVILAERPNDAAAWNDLGNLLILKGDESGGRQAYERALELDPLRASAHYNLALLDHRSRHLEEALKRYRTVITLDSDHAWAHYQIGRILEGWGQTSEAVAAYARAFALDTSLTFADVNPYIIENRLVTEALLISSRNDQRRDWAPRTYEDPGRIASLLAPPAPQPETADSSETEGAPPEAATGTAAAPEGTAAQGSATPPEPGAAATRAQPSAARPRGERRPAGSTNSAAPGTTEAPTTAGRVITGETLGSENVNQAVPPGSTPSSRRTTARPAPSAVHPPSTPPPRAAPSRESNEGEPSGTRRFRPGGRSTAQLDWQLRVPGGGPRQPAP